MLLRHRLYAHHLFGQQHWSANEVVDGLKAVVRFYRSSAAGFELKVCMFDMQGKSPAELQVFLQGSQEPLCCRLLEPDAVRQIQLGELQLRIVREFSNDSPPDRNRSCVELLWEPGQDKAKAMFPQDVAKAQSQLVDA
ncbi:MAG TPA: hypothetical protein VFO38_05885 [Candidatus Saccharimonadales bacterium]|nr:hypothetical protein [Candidatus Saccharimonadales bacterium]